MPRQGLDKETVIEQAARLADEVGFSNVTLKLLAERMNVKSPSLYKHIDGIDSLNKELMIYGYKMLEKMIIDKVMGKSGDDAVRALCNAYYELATNRPGVFRAMENYRRFVDAESKQATDGIFKVTSQIFSVYNLNSVQKTHLIRTFRGFLQGFLTLAVNNLFTDSIDIKESFDLSVNVLIAGVANLTKYEREEKVIHEEEN